MGAAVRQHKQRPWWMDGNVLQNWVSEDFEITVTKISADRSEEALEVQPNLWWDGKFIKDECDAKSPKASSGQNGKADTSPSPTSSEKSDTTEEGKAPQLASTRTSKQDPGQRAGYGALSGKLHWREVPWQNFPSAQPMSMWPPMKVV